MTDEKTTPPESQDEPVTQTTVEQSEMTGEQTETSEPAGGADSDSA